MAMCLHTNSNRIRHGERAMAGSNECSGPILGTDISIGLKIANRLMDCEDAGVKYLRQTRHGGHALSWRKFR